MMQVTHSTMHVDGRLCPCLVLTFENPRSTAERHARIRHHVRRCWRGKARRRALALLEA